MLFERPLLPFQAVVKEGGLASFNEWQEAYEVCEKPSLVIIPVSAIRHKYVYVLSVSAISLCPTIINNPQTYLSTWHITITNMHVSVPATALS